MTWRRAQVVLLSAQGMDAAAIAKVAFTSEGRVRDVIRNFNADGFASLYPKYKGGRPPKFNLGHRREIKKIARSKPAEHGLPFSAWSLSKLAEFLVAEGVVDDISHEGLRTLLREEGLSFQRVKTWKASKDRDYAAKKACVEHLYAIAGPACAAPSDAGDLHPHRRGAAPVRAPTSWAKTRCTGTSSRARPGPGSLSSAGICAYTPTNSSWLDRIEAQSPPCATSLSTAPTTPATARRPA